MDWGNFLATLLATALGGGLAIAGAVLVERREGRRSARNDANQASQLFIARLGAFFLRELPEHEPREQDPDEDVALLSAVTQFRLTPFLSQETRDAGERFHDAVNEAARRADRTQQTFKDECYPHQKHLQELIRRDLER